MSDAPTRYDLDRIFRLAMSVLVVVGLVWLARTTADVLIPLAAAVLMAYLLDPTVKRVQRTIENRSVAVVVTIVGGGLLFLLVAGLLIPMLAEEAKSLSQLAHALAEKHSGLRTRLASRLPPEWYAALENILNDEELRTTLTRYTDLPSIVVALFKKLVPQLWGLVSGSLAVLGLLLQGLLVLVYLVFILMDFSAFQESWPQYLPPKHREGIVEFLGEFNDVMARYFRGQFAVAMTVGVLFAIGFTILGLKMGILLGLGIGLLNMVPYLQIVGLVPAGLLAAMTAVEQGASFWTYGAGVLAVFAVVQALQDIVITPRIMGKAVGLRPVIILFCVIFWGKLLGFLGLLLAIPFTCLGLAYYRRIIAAQSQDPTAA